MTDHENQHGKTPGSLQQEFQELREQWWILHSKPPKVLYHYTTAKGMLGVIDKRCLWATNVRYMNDPSEIRYAANLIRKVIQEFHPPTRKIKPKTKTSSEGIERVFTFVVRLIQETIDKIPDTQESINEIIKTIEKQASVYIACFCTKNDLLSQWQGYGASGGGYALGFATEKIGNIKTGVRSHDVILRKVIYPKKTQESIVRKWLEGLFNLETTLLDKRPELFKPDLKDKNAYTERFKQRKLEREQLNDLIQKEFRKFLSECLVCFKHPGYRQENEWRAILFGDDTLDVSFRPSGGRVIPYVKIDIPESRDDGLHRLALRNITYGPTLDPEGTERSLKMLLKAHGYPQQPAVDILHSIIPFRQIS